MRYLTIVPLLLLVAGCERQPTTPDNAVDKGPAWAAKKVQDQGRWADNAIATGNDQAPIP